VEQFLPAHAAQGREVPGYITLPFYFMLHFFKPLLLVLMVALCVSPAYAQTQQTEANPAEPYSPYKWEIGTDLLWLINKNQLPAQSVFARYNYQTAAGKSRGVRVRLGLDYMQLDSSGTTYLNRGIDNSFRPLVRIGYEFQQPLGRQMFFYGVDLHLSYFHFNYTRRSFFDQYEHIGKERIFEMGPVLFCGYKYYLTQKLSVSAEFSAQSIYRTRRFVENGFTIPHFGPPASERGIQVDEFNFRILPITVINLSVHF
jgi:hypothetical protein